MVLLILDLRYNGSLIILLISVVIRVALQHMVCLRVPSSPPRSPWTFTRRLYSDRS